MRSRPAPRERPAAPADPPSADEVDRELAFHTEMQARRFLAEGLDADAARARALARLGDIDDVRAQCRALAQGMETDVNRTAWWQGIRQDARYALRVLRKAPVFTATALVTIAIGVGASTAIFSVVNDVLIRRLPYPGADRLFVVWNSYGPTGLNHASIAAAEFADYRDAHGAFEQLAALQPQATSLAGACAGCEPESVSTYVVSPNLFDVLRVQPTIGRPFEDADGVTGAGGVVMLSDALWRRRFGADAGVIGRSVDVGGRPRTIIGVMPASVRFPDAPLEYLRDRADLWVPYKWEQQRTSGRGNQNLAVIARVRDDLPASRAQTDLDTIADQFRAQFPNRYAGADRHWRIEAVPLRSQMVGDVRPALVVLLGAVGFVLLIACANVANLMLARGRVRRRELAVRSALGAGRGRLVRQLLVEAGLLTAAGGAAGVLLAIAGVRVLLWLDPSSLPRLDGPGIDATVLAFSIGVTMVTGLLLGLAPALRHSRVHPQDALAEGGRQAGPSPLRRRLRGLLVIAEVTLAMVVLIGAGLLMRSFSELSRVRPGFEPANTAVFEITLPRLTYDTAARRVAFFQTLAETLGTLPGVAHASGVYPLPMSGDGWSGSFFVEGRPVADNQPEPHAEYAVALPDYFKTLRIPLVSGREFSGDDTATAPPVVVIDEVLARKYWPGEPAVGKRLNPNGPKDSWATVVGVVSHVHNAGPQAEGEPQIYLPLAQNPQALMYLAVRTTGAAEPIVAAAGGAVRSVDARLPVAKLGLMTEVVDRAVSRERFNTLLFTIFGGVALVLAAVGLYGVMAFLVTERLREIGIRIALGGRPGVVRARIVGESLALTMAGVGLGIGCAIAMSQTMRGLLFGVQPTDPLTYAGITLLLVAAALAASYVPARRASRVDPVDVLRA